MKIAMHSNDLCERGVPKSVFNYADCLERILGHEIVCLYDKTSPFNDKLGIAKFSKRFTTWGYKDWSEVDDFLRGESVDFLYTQKAGGIDGKITSLVPTAVHAVFQSHQPHGNVYAYISEWLAKTMPGGHDYVPYMVELVEPAASLREELGIPDSALVFGRHGAFTQFDIPFVQECVADIARQHKHLYFLFLNTAPFCEAMDNIIHLPKTVDEQFISNFIHSCDAMLHARARGESFGLAVAEFLYQDKPVISLNGGGDQNHIAMLGEHGHWYSDAESLEHALLSFERLPSGSYASLVEEFQPTRVIQKFEQVFLDPLLASQ